MEKEVADPSLVAKVEALEAENAGLKAELKAAQDAAEEAKASAAAAAAAAAAAPIEQSAAEPADDGRVAELEKELAQVREARTEG